MSLRYRRFVLIDSQHHKRKHQHFVGAMFTFKTTYTFLQPTVTGAGFFFVDNREVFEVA